MYGNPASCSDEKGTIIRIKPKQIVWKWDFYVIIEFHLIEDIEETNIRETPTASHLLQTNILFPIKTGMPLYDLPTGKWVAKEPTQDKGLTGSLIGLPSFVLKMLSPFHIYLECIHMTVSGSHGTAAENRKKA